MKLWSYQAALHDAWVQGAICGALTVALGIAGAAGLIMLLGPR